MTADTVGGVWTFALELAAALAPRGAEVLLASLGGRPSTAQRREAAQAGNIVLAESGYKLEWMQDPWSDVEASGEWLLDLANGFQPDVVHLNSFGHAVLPWNAPVVLTAHSCVCSWWSAVRGGPAPAEWNRYRRLVEASLGAADLVTAPSEVMLRSLAQYYRTRPKAAMAVPNARGRYQYSHSSKEPLVLAAGRLWDEAKNIAAIARVAPRLKWPCAVAGEAQHPDGASARFDGCRMLGQLNADELAGWYGRASIYALPARYEPFGLTALEAALSGCALVLGDIASLREVWGDAAVFVAPEDDAAIEAALQRLIADSGLRAEMCERSAARARQFTPERMVTGYLEAYRAAIESRRLACVS